MSDDLELRSVGATVEDDTVVVRLALTNDSDRTLHVYREARRVRYDAATGTLSVGLTDADADTAGSASTFVLPAFTAVDPHGSTTVELRLPAVITRIGGVSAQGAPVIERVRIAEASDVVVEVAWSDTPFYRDPRPTRPENAHPAAQLRTWQRGVVTGRASLTRPSSA